MTQTATIAVTTFPIENLNLDGLKKYHLAESHAFSLLSYNRVRIEAAGTTEAAGALIDMSKTEARQLLAWLRELDASGQLQAEPFYHEPIKNAVHLDGTRFPATFGTVRVAEWDYTEQHEFDFCSDRSLLITNFYTDVAVSLNQAETVQLLAWLQEHFSVTKNLH